jgi:hypothetical protein
MLFLHPVDCSGRREDSCGMSKSWGDPGGAESAEEAPPTARGKRSAWNENQQLSLTEPFIKNFFLLPQRCKRYHRVFIKKTLLTNKSDSLNISIIAINLIRNLSRETEGLGPMTSGNLHYGKVPLPAECFHSER